MLKGIYVCYYSFNSIKDIKVVLFYFIFRMPKRCEVTSCPSWAFDPTVNYCKRHLDEKSESWKGEPKITSPSASPASSPGKGGLSKASSDKTLLGKSSSDSTMNR